MDPRIFRPTRPVWYVAPSPCPPFTAPPPFNGGPFQVNPHPPHIAGCTVRGQCAPAQRLVAPLPGMSYVAPTRFRIAAALCPAAPMRPPSFPRVSFRLLFRPGGRGLLGRNLPRPRAEGIQRAIHHRAPLHLHSPGALVGWVINAPLTECLTECRYCLATIHTYRPPSSFDFNAVLGLGHPSGHPL